MDVMDFFIRGRLLNMYKYLSLRYFGTKLSENSSMTLIGFFFDAKYRDIFSERLIYQALYDGNDSVR